MEESPYQTCQRRAKAIRYKNDRAAMDMVRSLSARGRFVSADRAMGRGSSAAR